MKRGLTLAETLLTLVVIGVVIALTIPTFYHGISQEMKINVMEKLYVAMNTNIESVLASGGDFNNDNGGDTFCETLSCLGKWNSAGNHNGVLADKRFFNVQSKCENCFTKGKLPNPLDANNSNFTAYQMEDGTTMAIFDFLGNCITSDKIKYSGSCKWVNSDGVECNQDEEGCNQQCEGVDVCSLVVFDVNGESGPNQPGVDRFAFYLADEKIGESHLVPFGLSENDKNVQNAKYNADGTLNTQTTNSGEEGYNKTAQIMINGWKPAK